MTDTVRAKGKTLAQLAIQRFKDWRAGKEISAPAKSPAEGLYNPFKFALDGFVQVGTPKYIGRTFAVTKIVEYVRQIGTRRLVSADYVLFEPPMSGEDTEGTWLTIRALPKNGQDGEVNCFIYTPRSEMGYGDGGKDLIAFIEESGTVQDEESGVLYKKEGSYEATIREATAEGCKTIRLKYWDCVNDEKPGEPRLFLVELDKSDREGWVQIFLGTPCATEDIRPIAGHTSASATPNR